MDTWKILVIDDRAGFMDSPGERYPEYQGLESHSYERKKFCIDFALNVDDARSKIRENEYDLVLIDVILQPWGDDKNGTIFEELFRQADERHAVGLVSGGWDETSISIVRDFLNHAHDVGIPLMFTLNDFKSGEYPAIATQIVSHVRRRRKSYRLEIGHDEDLRILHLSDLHFGSSDAGSIFGNSMSAQHLFDQIRIRWKNGPHLIVVTGDIADKGHPGDYHLAYAWFERFANEFGLALPSPQIMLVPGNHDFSVPLAGAKLLQIDPATKALVMVKSTKESRALGEFSFQPFDLFARRVSTAAGRVVSPSRAWVETGFREYGVVFSGFNTSRFSGEDAWPTRSIDNDDLFEIRSKLHMHSDQNRYKGFVHIALCHHSPVQYKGVRQQVDDRSLESFDEFALQGVLPPKVVLHGHQHRSFGHPFEPGRIVFCSPTPSKNAAGRAEDAPRGVNLFTLTRSGSVVRKIKGEFLHKRADGWWPTPIPGTSELDFQETCG